VNWQDAVRALVPMWVSSSTACGVAATRAWLCSVYVCSRTEIGTV
jgi:hypothetical protein